MNELKLYRKRIIPDECLLLENDRILYHDQEVIVTKWDTIRPKKTLHHGYSCYFLERGYKVSKFYDHENHIISWYCDIVSYEYTEETDTYIVTDLLADVIVYPDGFVKVVDLDELGEALEKGPLSQEQLKTSLRRLDNLLNLIYRGAFSGIQEYINGCEEKCGA